MRPHNHTNCNRANRRTAVTDQLRVQSHRLRMQSNRLRGQSNRLRLQAHRVAPVGVAAARQRAMYVRHTQTWLPKSTESFDRSGGSGP